MYMMLSQSKICKISQCISLLAIDLDKSLNQMVVGQTEQQSMTTSQSNRKKRPMNVDQAVESTVPEGMSRMNLIGADLLAEVFRWVPFEERLRTVPLVCKAWKNASCDPSCWRTVDMESWFEKRVKVDFWWEFECESRLEFLVKKVVDRSCGQLRELRTMHCSDVSVQYIANRCPLLRVLSIRSSPLVTDKSAAMLADNCPDMQELDVRDCYNISNHALDSLRRWKPCKLQIKPIVLYFFWQHMLRICMSTCRKLELY